MNRVPYLSVVMSMIYIRPDLAHVISMVSRFIINPRKAHWEAINWIMRYLKGTTNNFLVYDANI